MTLMPVHIHAALTCYFSEDQRARHVPVYRPYNMGGNFPANTRCSLSIVLMLSQRQTYWPSIKSPLGRLVVGGTRT